jgi:transposase
MVYVGVDLHKQISQVAVLTPEGDVKQHRLKNEVGAVQQFFAALPSPARVAIEASGTWWWLVDLLEQLGHQPVLSHPKQTKAIAAARLKNDRVDAARLALLLRGDLLPTVWIPPVSLREARELLRHRVSLVGVRTGIKNQLQALLARRNLQPSSSAKWMTVRGQRELAALPLPPIPSTIREDCRGLLRLLDEQIRQVDQELVRRWGQDSRVHHLRSIPGIGVFIAMLLVLELGDIHRFPSAKHVASYAGLVPRVSDSGERVRRGHISKEGNRLLRWALVLAATQAARRPGPLRAWYRTVAHRKGKKVARVALARRLAEIVYQVWKEECDYVTTLRRSGREGVSPQSGLVS